MRLFLIIVLLVLLPGCPDEPVTSTSDSGPVITEHIVNVPENMKNCILSDTGMFPGDYSDVPYMWTKYICENKTGEHAAYVQFHNIYQCRDKSHKIMLGK